MGAGAVKDNKKLKLNGLSPIRWSLRIYAVRGMKTQYIDILKIPSKISLQSDKQEKRFAVLALKKVMEQFEFNVFIMIREVHKHV